MYESASHKLFFSKTICQSSQMFYKLERANFKRGNNNELTLVLSGSCWPSELQRWLWLPRLISGWTEDCEEMKTGTWNEAVASAQTQCFPQVMK